MTFYAETGTHRLTLEASSSRNAALNVIQSIMGNHEVTTGIGKVIEISSDPFDQIGRCTNLHYTEGLLDELGFEVSKNFSVAN